MEEWRDIPGFEGLYQVSDKGNVRSLGRTRTVKSKWGGVMNVEFPGKTMVLGEDRDGYRIVTLTSMDKKQKQYRVHRLVAMAFIPNTENKPQIDHIQPTKDGGTDCVDNLRWVTSKENYHNPISAEKCRNWERPSGEKHHWYGKKRPEHAKKLSIPIIEIKEDGTVVEWGSTLECASKYGFSAPHLTNAVNGKNRKKGHYYNGSQFYKKSEYEKLLEDLASQQLN